MEPRRALTSLIHSLDQDPVHTGTAVAVAEAEGSILREKCLGPAGGIFSKPSPYVWPHWPPSRSISRATDVSDGHLWLMISRWKFRRQYFLIILSCLLPGPVYSVHMLRKEKAAIPNAVAF